MPKLRLLLSLILAGSLCTAAPAIAAEPVTLSDAEVEAIKLRLIEAKPNVGAVSVMGFLAPGSAQAYMGHVDRSLMIWGGYLVGFTVIQALVPAAPAAAGGPRLSDLAVTSLFLAVAAGSGLDAYFLSLAERQKYDQLINALTDKQRAAQR